MIAKLPELEKTAELAKSGSLGSCATVKTKSARESHTKCDNDISKYGEKAIGTKELVVNVS